MNYLTPKEMAKIWGVSDQQVRIYCREGRVPGVICKNKTWMIPEGTKKPDKKDPSQYIHKKPRPLAKKLVKQKKKKNYHGFYDYVQINLTYSSCRMASNRLKMEQVESIFKKGKVKVGFEPMKVSDVIEVMNHCLCVDYMLEHFEDSLTPKYIKKLHFLLMNGTVDERKERVRPGEFRTAKSNRRDNLGVKADKIDSKLRLLMAEYEFEEEHSLEDILDFHVKFEEIFPFEDGNGRIGRLIMFKECLRNNVTPFILDDKRRGRYLDGIRAWPRKKDILTEVIEEAQQRFAAQMVLQDLREHGSKFWPAGYTED